MQSVAQEWYATCLPRYKSLEHSLVPRASAVQASPAKTPSMVSSLNREMLQPYGMCGNWAIAAVIGGHLLQGAKLSGAAYDVKLLPHLMECATAAFAGRD